MKYKARRGTGDRVMNSGLLLHGHEWHAKSLSVEMGFDAMRLAMGGKPRTFTPDEIILWLRCVAEASQTHAHNLPLLQRAGG